MKKNHYHITNIYLIFSSCEPRVSNTRPHIKSLNEMPFCVPPHALYSQSANTGGTQSVNISWTKALFVNIVPFDPVERLKASLNRLSSFSDTV